MRLWRLLPLSLLLGTTLLALFGQVAITGPDRSTTVGAVVDPDGSLDLIAALAVDSSESEADPDVEPLLALPITPLWRVAPCTVDDVVRQVSESPPRASIERLRSARSSQGPPA